METLRSVAHVAATVIVAAQWLVSVGAWALQNGSGSALDRRPRLFFGSLIVMTGVLLAGVWL